MAGRPAAQASALSGRGIIPPQHDRPSGESGQGGAERLAAGGGECLYREAGYEREVPVLLTEDQRHEYLRDHGGHGALALHHGRLRALGEAVLHVVGPLGDLRDLCGRLRLAASNTAHRGADAGRDQERGERRQVPAGLLPGTAGLRRAACRRCCLVHL